MQPRGTTRRLTGEDVTVTRPVKLVVMTEAETTGGRPGLRLLGQMTSLPHFSHL